MTAHVRFANALAWHTYELARGLHARGHEVLVLCAGDAPHSHWIDDAPFRVRRDLRLSSASPLEIARALRGLRDTLQDFRPDVLNPHCPPGHAYLAYVRGLARTAPVLIRTVADPRPPKRHPLNGWLHRRRTDGMIFTTASSRRRYHAVLRVGRPRARVILPGFRAEDFVAGVRPRSYRRELGAKESQMLAGVVARMSPEKGQEVLLRALALLPSRDRDRIFCVLAGEDARERSRHDLSTLARQLGVAPNVAFLGRLDDVRPLMAELDLALIPSTRSEAVCRVALEYMSFGVPIIASDVNILPEVVRHGESGWTYPNRSARALAACLSEAVSNMDERVRRGRRGYELVRSAFSHSREMEETVRFFEEVLSVRRRAQV